MEIEIDWNQIKTEEDFYCSFLPKLNAPEWHGHNLDALSDSLITGSVNDTEPPYTIVSMNTSEDLGSLKDFQIKVLAIFAESAAEPKREIQVHLK